MPNKPFNLHEQLQALASKFAERLQQDLPALAIKAEQLGQLHELSAQQSQLGVIRDQLHRLAGSAGSFGFNQLGNQARILEQQADQCLTLPALDTGVLKALAAQIQELTEIPLNAEALQPMPKPVDLLPEQPDRHHIYILEEEPLIGDSMQLTLRSFGYEVQRFLSIAELDSALAENQPDALILDLNLSDGGGIAYTQTLKKRLTGQIPLLIISQKDNFAMRLEAVRAGAMGFFTRPVDLTQLENRLERCFAQQQGEPYRVLIVDDDQELATRFALVLRNARMLVEVLKQPTQILQRMQQFNPEVVLLDINMPGCSGTELAQIIRFQDEWLRVPIVYLSAETDLARQMDALLRAGDDFVTKPISDSALLTTVFSRAQRARLLSTALARDSLTGLLKHADIKEQISIEVERALRSGKPASVVMLDIDHFKQVNDRFGHPAGDNVIRALANLLRQRLRRVDSLGRYGGEEFAAVLPECSAEQAEQILNEIRQRFAELSFMADGNEFHVTLSAGIAQSGGKDDSSDLLELADKALYVAKHGGRNQIRRHQDNP